MPIDRVALEEQPRLMFRLTSVTTKNGALLCDARLKDNLETGFSIRLPLGKMAPTAVIDLADAEAFVGALAIFGGVDTPPQIPQSKGPLRIGCDLYSEAGVHMTKWFLRSGKKTAELYCDLIPGEELGWFRNKDYPCEAALVLAAILAVK